MDASDEQVVREELVRTQQEARRSIHRGVALMASVPFVLIVAMIAAFGLTGFAGALAVLLGGVYMLVGGIAGLAMSLGGIAEHRRCTRGLRGLDELRKLPEARVVLR